MEFLCGIFPLSRNGREKQKKKTEKAKPTMISIQITCLHLFTVIPHMPSSEMAPCIIVKKFPTLQTQATPAVAKCLCLYMGP